MILGIDIGNKFMTIATIKNGHIEIILNESSKRRTNSVILVDQNSGKRVVGDLAYSSFVSNYKNTIVNVKYSMKYENNEYNNIPIHQTLTGFINYCVSIAKFQTKGDIVLTVPSYFEDIERQIYLDVAKITNLNVTLCDEYVAVCQYYGFYNCKGLPNDKKFNVVFVDIGDINTTLYGATFSNDACDVQMVAFDKIGGLYLDQKLVQYFTEKIKNEKGVNIHSPEHIKSTIRTFLACEKLKKNLSVYSETSTFVECLYNVDGESYDYTFSLTRQVFEELIADQIEKLKTLLSNCTMSQIDRVELIGGGSRVPVFKKVIEDFFLMKTCATINAEETVSQGAALVAATNATFVKMRKYVVRECVVNKTELTCEQTSVSNLADKPNNLFEYEIDNSTLLNDKEKYKPVVMVGGGKTWHIKSSKIVDNKFYVETAYVNGILDIVNCFTVEQVDDERKEKKLKYCLKENKYVLGDETIKKLKEMEIKILQQNKYLEQVENKRNKLEENIYAWRDKIDEEFNRFISNEERSELDLYFDESLDWLYDKDIPEIDKKNKELAEKVKKFEQRQWEHQNRQKLVGMFRNKLSEYIDKSDNIANNLVRGNLLVFCDKISDEFDGKVKEQDNKPKNQDVEFTCNEISEYIDKLTGTCDDYLNLDKGNSNNENDDTIMKTQ